MARFKQSRFRKAQKVVKTAVRKGRSAVKAVRRRRGGFRA